jgi:hypothetical protein
MPLSVSDRVKSSAVLFDQGTEDENGLTFSQRQLGKGLGAFCFGVVSFVYRQRGREIQKYRVRWDDGSISQVQHQHLELVSVEEGSRDVGGGTDINEETDFDRFVTVDGEETDDEDERAPETTVAQEVTRVGGVVDVSGVKWKRVENIGRDVREGMERFDLQVKPFVINGSTTEKDLFWLCMPVSREKLTEVVRSRAGFLLLTPPFLSLSYGLLIPLLSLPTDESNDKYREWSPTHIDKFLRCIFGGAQYKVPLLFYVLVLLPLCIA